MDLKNLILTLISQETIYKTLKDEPLTVCLKTFLLLGNNSFLRMNYTKILENIILMLV